MPARTPQTTPASRAASDAPSVSVGVRRDQSRVPFGGDTRYLGVDLVATSRPRPTDANRTPVSIGIVIDRSGSMQGRKIEVAKHAAIEIVNRLHDGDEASLTIFDNETEVLLPRTRINAGTRARFRELVSAVYARGGTALHDGWVHGSRAIAPEGGAASGRVVRCYLLTDGQANSGVTDPQAIANDVAAARAEFGVVTSTFGIGDYDEDLLAPMATAGGGLFHNLRDTDEIVATFLGELGEAVNVEVSAVTVEIDHDEHARIDSVSGLWVRGGRLDPATAAGGRRTTVLDVGDLVGAETRTIIVGVVHPAGDVGADGPQVRVRLTWRVPGSDVTGESDRHEVSWTYADAESCDLEPIDERLASVAGRHLMHRSHREAARLSRDGFLAESRDLHAASLRSVARFAQHSVSLSEEVAEWDGAMADLSVVRATAAAAKEVVSKSDRIRKGRRDLRGGESTPTV
jgi:Ca-activated chloride channel family protein